MHLQNEKLLVVGDSNVGMMKNLYDSEGELLGIKNVDFWYETGSAFNTVIIKDGWISSKTANGLPGVYFKDFDGILFSGGRLRVMSVFEEFMENIPSPYSANFIAAAVKDYVKSLPGFRKLAALRTEFSGPITVVTTPLRGVMAKQDIPYKLGDGVRETYDAIWDSYRSAFNEVDAELLAIPFSATVNGFLIKSIYNLEEGDELHKNNLYAKMILDQHKVGERNNGSVARFTSGQLTDSMSRTAV